MSRYNPHHEVEPIYKAAARWRTESLIGDRSVFRADRDLWTTPLFDELITWYCKNLDVGEGDFLTKLKSQLSRGSPECKQLMAECLWLLRLFQASTPKASPEVVAAKKRAEVEGTWSWSGESLDVRNGPLATAVLGGIANPGLGFFLYFWKELKFLIEALSNFKMRSSADRASLASDSEEFSKWLCDVPTTGRRQLIHILPHLLFPEQFERISVLKYKHQILAAFDKRPLKEVRKWSIQKVDRHLLDLRKRLEREHGGPVDYWEEPFYSPWPPNGDDPPPPRAKNLILYGPPGTGKTHRLKTILMPEYQGSGEKGNRFEFVTFHQSYAYEDFVEGIRPTTTGAGQVTFRVRPGVLKELCRRAAKNPEKRFALFIDEINRGNIAKVFGELITLVEVDKRIRTDGSGQRRSDCEGMEVTLPYSGELFGVPANVDIIGTMNTADRSIALLDSALRRRFRFEELMPRPSLLDPVDDDDGGEIDLGRLLEAMNARLSRLLHRDQAIGHSYFMGVSSFDELCQVFARQILPFLQEAFYDDWRQIRYVLADQAVREELQLVQVRPLSGGDLFPDSDIGDGEAFTVIGEGDISPDAIRKIYEPLAYKTQPAEPGTPQPEADEAPS